MPVRPETLLPQFIRRKLEERNLKRKSFEWGYELYQRKIEEGLSVFQVNQLVREAEQSGLDLAEINLGYLHSAIKTALETHT